MNQKDGLYRQVEVEVARRTVAMEAAGEPAVRDWQDIIQLTYRRLGMRRPNLPPGRAALQALIVHEVDRSVREDRKLWTASFEQDGDEPSPLVVQLAKRGMKVEAIKRYRLESGAGLRDARLMVDALAEL